MASEEPQSDALLLTIDVGNPASSSASDLGAGAEIADSVIVASADAGMQPSSPRPSAIIGVSLSTASRASGPLATSRTLSPRAVSRAINDVTLRALAKRSPSCSRISLLNVLAVLLSTAAGRACKPFGFGRMIASEVTVGPTSAAAAAPAPFNVRVSTGVLPTVAVPDP